MLWNNISNFNFIQSDFNSFYTNEISPLDDRIEIMLNRDFEQNITAALGKYDADEGAFPITIDGKTYSYPMKRKSARLLY